MTDTTPAEPVCKFEEGCHRVVACEPGCAAATVPAPAPTDQAALRDRIAEALRPGSRDRGGQYPEGLLRDVDAVLAVLLGPIPPDTDIPTWTAIRAIQLMNEAGRETEAQRLALSQALGLGTGAPWDAIRDRAAELAALPEPANRAAIRAAALREAADFVGNDDDCDCGGCDTCLPRKLAAELRRMADAASGPGGVTGETQQPCDGCGHPEHPARQCPVTLYGERCACDEPLAGEAQQPETQARRMMRSRFPSRPGTATVASDMCPRCKGDNSEAWALCARCAEQQPATQAPGTSPCTCADAGDCFAPAGHYADCPHHAPPAAVSQPDGEA
jgi:hypothetical protein